MEPEYHQFEEYRNRLQKLEEIKALDMEPYPHKFSPNATAKSLKETYKDKEIGHSDDAASGSTPSVCLAGRLMLFRAMGKNAFAHIQDHTGRIQLMFNRDATEVVGYDPEKAPQSPKPIKFIEKKIDLGDIIGVEGNLFRTQKGELTLFVKKCTLLCKTLLPLPDKHSGLTDKGILYRKRWLDLIINEETKKRFELRSKILKIIREYFEESNFLEVETATLQNIYGGANAKPFKTHLNALKQEMYLRISLEIPLKKLMVGGFDRVFEIGKVYRNEGIDKSHNPEFTLCESYAAYWDYNDMMSFIEKLFEKIALKLFNSTEIPMIHEGKEIILDLKAPWKRMTMKEAVSEYGKIHVDTLSDQEIKDLLKEMTKQNPDDVDKASRGMLIAYLFEEFVEHHLIQPHHIIDHPIETTPLCKIHRQASEHKEILVERFESFILGFEFTNAYTELNDPIVQRKLLEQQQDLKEAGDEEAHPFDEEFIEAICQGMPPTGGLGFGVDRLIMLFTKAASIRDVILFPLMKGEE